MGKVEATSAFTGTPQPVEVFHGGTWYAGELLGWRHEGDGRCLARVRCVVDGLRHSTWKELADLRLPAPTVPQVTVGAGPAAAAPGRRMPDSAPAGPSLGRRPAAAGHGGRHNAPDDTQPHILLADRGPRPQPAGRAPPAPRRPAPRYLDSDTISSA